MCALRAVRPTTTANVGVAGNQEPQAQATHQTQAAAQPQATTPAPEPQVTAQVNQVPAVQGNGAVVVPGTVQDLNAGILDNIDGMGNTGNFVTMDGSNFLFKADNTEAPSIDLIVTYGKRYYQWVEENGESKTYHDSDVKLDDRYRLKFEMHWLEDGATEGDEPLEMQFHLPTASAMRFINYVTQLSKAGFGVGSVVTQATISRQTRTGTSDRYSRTEFTMIGIVNPDGSITTANTGITTVNKK